MKLFLFSFIYFSLNSWSIFSSVTYIFVLCYINNWIIELRIFNILIDSSSLNIFSSLVPHFLQIIEKTVFSKMYDISRFQNFLYLLQTIQHIFFILTFLEAIENILVLFCHSFHVGLEKINWYTLRNFYLNKLFNFFWNMFNSEAIKIFCILRCLHIQSHPVSSCWFILHRQLLLLLYLLTYILIN